MTENPASSRATRFGMRSVPRGRGAGSGFGLGAALVGTGLVIALVVGFTWSAVAGSATPAVHPRIFGGSIVLDDNRPLVVLDLATGSVTVRLSDVFSQVNATSYADVQAVPLDSGTLLLNRETGNFNLLGKDNFVVKRTDGGVGLGPLQGTTGATGIADGASAYIVRSAPLSTVSLVGADTVQAAVTAQQSGDTGQPSGSGLNVAARGFAALDGAVPNQAGASVVTQGDLFTLVDRSGSQKVVQLSPSPGSPNGLIASDRGVLNTTDTPAALEAAGGMVGLASPGRVRIYVPTGTPAAHRDVAIPGTSQATVILPVSGAPGPSGPTSGAPGPSGPTSGGQGPSGARGTSLWFLARSVAGWSVFGVSASGQATTPQLLNLIPASASLVAPVLSGGRLYTMSRSGSEQPALWTIDPLAATVTTVPGEATYPRASASERADFTTTQVASSGPRVIFDNPDSLRGVVVFTDGSHAPVTFDKSTAVTVNATGPVAVASTKAKPAPGNAGHQPVTTLPPSPPPSVAAQVSQQVTCSDTTQTPRAPQIGATLPSTHSVLVHWTYPLLDEQDCEPDSWVVQVTALQGPQPTLPAQQESGQLQYQFAGLRPATPYQVTVTAYIAHQSTVSASAGFTTEATGPDAPTSVTTASDGNGGWNVSWTPCTAATCYVPASAWVVTGAACGAAFVGQPPSLQVSGDTTTADIPSGALLGTSLSFQVRGLTASGLAGDPTKDHGCTAAWRPPDPSHISLKDSAVPSGATITATVEVATDEAQVQAFGSSSTEFTYSVGSATIGPTTGTAATFSGLAPGTAYQPTVTVAPTGHPSAAVTVSGTPFTQTLPWPANLGLQVSAVVAAGLPNIATVTATFRGAPPVPLSAAGQLKCGSLGQPETGDLNSSSQLSFPVDLTTIGGSCSLTLTLTETITMDYGIPSPPLSAPFSVGVQIDSSTFSVNHSEDLLGNLTITVNGQTDNRGINWLLAVTSPQSCVSDANTYHSPGNGPPPLPVMISLGQCDNVDQPASIVVTVSYTYLGADIVFEVSGSAPPPPSTTTTTVAPTTTTTVGGSTTTNPTTTTSTVPSTTTTTTKAALGASGTPLNGSFAPGALTVLADTSTPITPGPDQGADRAVVDVIIAVGGLALLAGGFGRRARRRRRN